MNTHDLLRVLQKRLGHRITFAGVLSANLLETLLIPDVPHKPLAFIVNILEAGDQRLGHWVAFATTGKPNKTIYFFDSFAMPPRIYSKHFMTFLRRHRDYTLYTLNMRLQADTSIVCGLYACYFIYFLSRETLHRVIRRVMNTFSDKNYLNNDKKIFNFYKAKLNILPCDYWKKIDHSLITYRQCVGGVSLHVGGA